MNRLLCAALVCALPPLAQAQADRIREGSLRVVGRDVPMPLKHTDVRAEISGFVARVQVDQTFENPFQVPIEAIYVFPLPDRGAVDSMTLTVGDRVVKGEIKRREEARAIYEQAKSRGQTAALLDQERPNIFTQSVANIAPGDAIHVSLTYVAPLEYDHGEYTFNFPMVVGPRYIPGGALSGQSQGTGVVRDTDRVEDASRITPPMLAQGQRSGHDISVTVILDAGIAIQDIHSVSHDVTIQRKGQREARVELKPGDAIPNKDFILRYKVAGAAMEAGVLTHRDERGGFFTLMIQPQEEFRQREITPKEMFFVIDQSCSQSGLPIEKEKGIVNEALDRMNPYDTFQIMTFNNGVHFLADRPMANTPDNVRRARSFVNGLSANGGTEMLQGVVACLDQRRDPERLRFVMFLTDGYVGNDSEIIHAVEAHVGNARLYTYGVGSSVNHYLLDRMAELGRGYTQYARPDEDTRKSVALFYERIAKPYLVDVSVDFADLGVKDVYPKVIRDLFAYQPIILTGRFEGPGGLGTVTLKGKVGGQVHVTKVSVDFPRVAQAENEALASMYARARIEHLSALQYGGEKAEVVREITDTALTYHLMSQYTSFVAVEEHRVAGADGRPPTLTQAVPAPDGTHASADAAADPASNNTGGFLGFFGIKSRSSPHQAVAAPRPPAMPQPVTATPTTPPQGPYGLSGMLGGSQGGGGASYNGAPIPPTSAPAPTPAPAPTHRPSLPRSAPKAEEEPGEFAPKMKLQPEKKAIAAGLIVSDLLLKGPLPRSDAQLVLKAVLERLARHPGRWAGAQGTLLVRVVVRADGSVASVDILQDGVQSAPLIAAFTQALRTTNFPVDSDETTLTVSVRVR